MFPQGVRRGLRSARNSSHLIHVRLCRHRLCLEGDQRARSLLPRRDDPRAQRQGLSAELILLDALVRGDQRRDDYNAMRAAWRRGDIGAMLAEDSRQRKLNPGAEMRLLDYRNLRWIPKIEALIKSGVPTSIVVGTGHFCGTNSVIDLLEKKGYKIEQL